MRLRAIASAAVVVVVAACSPDETCPSCDDPINSGRVENPALAEISGIAASLRHPDVVYAHNDSGDSSRVFALSAAGADLATFEIDGAQNDDWEDIARAPCASGDCLYIADIGDNELLRTSYTIYLVAEPTTIDGVQTLPSESTTFAYGDGPIDAEVLLVHPRTGAVTIVSKSDDGPASIYELGTLAADAVLVAEKVGELEPPKGSAKFTGGSIHPDASGILLRTQTRLFHYPMDPEQTAAEALRADGCVLQLADEVQGEAVTWLGGGDGIMTIGEGASAAVNVAACGDPL